MDKIAKQDPRYELAMRIFGANHWPSDRSVRTVYEAVQEFKKRFEFHADLAVAYGDYVESFFWWGFCSLKSWEPTLKDFYEELLAGKSFTLQQLAIIQDKLNLQMALKEAYEKDDLTAFKAALDDGADPEYRYFTYGWYEVLNQSKETKTLCQRYLLTLDTENAREYRAEVAKKEGQRKVVEEAEAAIA